MRDGTDVRMCILQEGCPIGDKRQPCLVFVKDGAPKAWCLWAAIITVVMYNCML